MSDTRESIPELLLEQYALGELNEGERRRIEAALASDPDLRSRLEELRRSDAEILAELPPAEIARAVRARMLSAAPRGPAGVGTSRFGAERRMPRFAASRFMGFAAAAAALLVVGTIALRTLVAPSLEEQSRPKGGAPALVVYAKAAPGPIELVDGQSAREGDVLQLKYGAGTARFGAILSLDGRKSITWHLPASGAAAPGAGVLAPPLDPAGAALPSAYELDDAPSFERFFIVVSDTDFDLTTIDSAMLRLADSAEPSTGVLQLPAGLSYKSFLLRKAGGR